DRPRARASSRPKFGEGEAPAEPRSRRMLMARQQPRPADNPNFEAKAKIWGGRGSCRAAKPPNVNGSARATPCRQPQFRGSGQDLGRARLLPSREAAEC